MDLGVGSGDMDALAQLLRDAGYGFSHDESSVSELLREQGQLGESHVAEVIAVLIGPQATPADQVQQAEAARILA